MTQQLSLCERIAGRRCYAHKTGPENHSSGRINQRNKRRKELEQRTDPAGEASPLVTSVPRYGEDGPKTDSRRTGNDALEMEDDEEKEKEKYVVLATL